MEVCRLTKDTDMQVHSFVEDLLVLHGIRKSVAPIVLGMYSYLNQHDQLVLNAFIKTELAEQAQTTKGTIENIIVQLQQAQLLIRLERGTYTLHPVLLKGLNSLEQPALTMKLTYTANGRLIQFEEE